MQIYQSEWDDGVAEKISAKSSVAYISEAQLCTKKDINISKESECLDDTLKSLAALSDADLYYVQSILVSSSWNKNDDVFDKAEVWKAKSTPEDKPTNLEHDEDQIVGHIVSNWPVDVKGNIIPDNTDVEDLPEKFHILTGSVIYRNFTNPELRDRANALIDQIKDGTKYVSMECYFDNFDYGLINKSTGEYKVLERNNNTAYLTKHLRSYGGLGEYEDYKIGRVLRNINFSGKGFVDKPANPESVIFDSDTIKNMLSEEKVVEDEKEKIVNFSNNSVSNIQATSNPETDNMSLEKDVESLQEKVEAMSGCGEVVKEAYNKVSELEAKVMELEATMHKKEEELKAELEKAQLEAGEKDKYLEEYKQKMQAEIEEAASTNASQAEESATAHTEALTAKDAEIETLKNELSTANEAIEAFKAKEAELARQAKIMSRVSELVESGVKTDVAEATVAKFETLDDESFATIKSLVSSDMPEWVKDVATEEEAVAEEVEADTEEVAEEAVQAEEAEEADESPEAVEAASTETLEDVEVEEEVSLSVGSEDDSELQTTRASLVEFVQSRLGKNQN